LAEPSLPATKGIMLRSINGNFYWFWLVSYKVDFIISLFFRSSLHGWSRIFVTRDCCYR
jgi:hypothetical protein